MTAVAAARWDVRWSRGGGWSAHLVRRDRAGTNLGIAAPARMELRRIDDTFRVPPVLTVTGTVATDESGAELDVTPAQVDALDDDRYWHRIIVGDPLRAGRPMVLLTGYVTLLDGPEV
jgi:hypothetical protein